MTLAPRLRLPALLAVLLCAALVTPGIAAAVKFSGKSKQNLPVKFKVRGGKVRAFYGNINMFCIQAGTIFDVVHPPRAMRISGGKFSYKGKVRQGTTPIKVSGRINGRRANGKIQMSTSRYSIVTSSTQPCLGTAKWTAKAK